MNDDREQSVNLFLLWSVLWKGKWRIVGIVALAIVLCIVYWYIATPWYRADALLIPNGGDESPAFANQLTGLGGLAGIAGLSVRDENSVEALALLTSRELIESFIRSEELMPVLFAEDWDPIEYTWSDPDISEWPDIREGVSYFIRELLDVRQVPETGLITVAIEWTDAEMAARWVSILVRLANDHMRQRALNESRANIAFLNNELSSTQIPSLTQSIANLLEIELQKLMLARGGEEYAFRVIDPPVVPYSRSRPRLVLLLLVGVVLSSALSVFFELMRYSFRLRASQHQSSV